eukprot:m.82472 g.82472  ORF g.82472 m.82472 type:complete len:196 (+) comp14729_c0_seq4:200-787(+)
MSSLTISFLSMLCIASTFSRPMCGAGEIGKNTGDHDSRTGVSCLSRCSLAANPCPTSSLLTFPRVQVVVVVEAGEGTRGKDVSVDIFPQRICCKIKGKTIFEGKLGGVVVVDDSLWTVEDRRLVRIVLTKSGRRADNTWPSLLEGQYAADAGTFDEMQKKMTLERFQRENPGFDFSGADLTGNYQNGGPDLTGPS